ncbi:NRDE family protein [Desulfosediminicola sp.]|uniref:NRDE family protein n=1 Tax=Desulfosediminicola sp. TaxID=2886825 RepID=UPI003AF28A4B
MCLILFAYKYHPGFKLIFAANRDEFLDRPTAPLGYNFPGENILGGRDLKAGGSWLVTGGDGRVGAITNYRDPTCQLAAAPSRGEIVLDYLRSGQSPSLFLAGFAETSSRYNPFNLLLGDSKELCYFSNVTMKSRRLGPGLYGLSNHLLDTAWPKVTLGKRLLKNLLAATALPDREQFFVALTNNVHPPDEQLPDTGVGLDWERLLGSLFIHSGNYGTRSSSVLLIDYNDDIFFTEKSFEHSVDGWSNVGEVSHSVVVKPK